MDFDTDKYDLFNAPQYVDFNEFVRNDGFRNDNADDFFETHREEDDFFPAETSPSSQLVLKSSESDIQIILLQEPPKSVPVPAQASPEVSSTQSEDKPKYHPSECYPGGTGPGTGPTMSMFMPASPVVTPRPATSGLSESNKSNLALGNESDRGTQYYYQHQQSTTTTTYLEPHSHYVDSEDTENDENSQPESETGIGEKKKQEQGYKKKWPIKLTSSEEVIMKEESMKTLNTTILEKTRRIAELEQLEKARIKAELEKAEKLRIQAELEKSEKLRLKLEQERAEHARIEAETARLEKIRIQAELERIERARMEAEEKAEKARLEADIERQEKARIQAELEKLESIRRQAEKFELEMEKQQRFQKQQQQQQLEIEAEKAADDVDVDVDVGTMSLTTARTVDAQTELDSKCLGDNLKNNKYEYEINQNLTEDEDDTQIRTQNQALNQQYQRPEMKKHYSYDQYEHTAHPDYSKYSNFSTPHSHDLHFQLPILGSGAAGAQRGHGYPPKVMIKEPMMLLPKRTYNKVTIPQPFKFAESRPRKVQEAEVDNFKFRARPAPLKALHGGPPSNCQIQKSYKPKTTQPSEFHFASEDRIRERQLKRISQPNPLGKKEPSPGPGPGMGRKSRIGRVSVQHPHYNNGSSSPKKEQYQSTETVGSSASGGDMTTVSGSGSIATTISTVMGTACMLRKPRIRTRSSSVDSNHRGLSPSTITNMKPFSFEERDRETLKKKEEKIRNAIRAEIPIRNFHAQRVPNYSLSLKRLPKKKPAPPTCPEPFHFKCDQRGSAYQEEIQKKSQEEYMKLKQQSEFVAQPNEVIYKRPYEPERSAVPLVEPLDIVMNSDRRAEDRAKFDSMIKEKEAELDELRKQDKMLKQEQEVKLSNTLRQMCVHHAKPAPKSRIFEVKSSDKPLTEPKSPAFELLPSQRRPRNYENKENAK